MKQHNKKSRLSYLATTLWVATNITHLNYTSIDNIAQVGIHNGDVTTDNPRYSDISLTILCFFLDSFIFTIRLRKCRWFAASLSSLWLLRRVALIILLLRNMTCYEKSPVTEDLYENYIFFKATQLLSPGLPLISFYGNYATVDSCASIMERHALIPNIAKLQLTWKGLNSFA